MTQEDRLAHLWIELERLARRLGWGEAGSLFTAFAFTLWNLSLQRLSAVESASVNNTMLVQIALLAWLLLGERLTPAQAAGPSPTPSGT